MAGEALLRCEAVAWVDPDGCPPVVEVVMTDASGHRWVFHDKVPIFDATRTLAPGSSLPRSVSLRVRVLADGDETTVVTDPYGVESVDGHQEFVVRPDQLVPIPAT